MVELRGWSRLARPEPEEAQLLYQDRLDLAPAPLGWLGAVVLGQVGHHQLTR